MKHIIIILYFISSTVAAQSPYLSVKATMDTSLYPGRKYLLEMKICSPVTRTSTGDYFSHDTSAIDFMSLMSPGISCAEYSLNGEGVEVLAGDIRFAKYNEFTFSNQVFAWEKIIVFRITDVSGDVRTSDPMYIVVPVRYKAFVSHILLKDIPYYQGELLDASDAPGKYRNSALQLEISPKTYKRFEYVTHPAREWIE